MTGVGPGFGRRTGWLEEGKACAEYRCDLRRITSGVRDWTNYTEIVDLRE